MKFKDLIQRGIEEKQRQQREADVRERAVARSKGGRLRSRNRPVPSGEKGGGK